MDFSDVYHALDVDTAAELLVNKLVAILDIHAPWIVYQQRKHYAPWITKDTIEKMKIRDKYKEEAKEMALNDGNIVSAAQLELWSKYRKLRNSLNNKMKNEEKSFKRKKLNECRDSSSSTWNLAKTFMGWKGAGPPTQLEVVDGTNIHLVTKAFEIAHVMNSHFIDKVKRIKQSLVNLPLDLSGCFSLMRTRI